MSVVDALPAMDRRARLDRLRTALDGAGCDALLVTRLVNIRWLTGFTGSAAMVLVVPDDLVFVTDGRYGEQSARQLADAGVEARIEVERATEPQLRALVSAATAANVRRLGLEAHDVSWASARSFADRWFEAVDVVATDEVIEDLRRVKDDGEVARIEAAAAIASEALDRVRHRLLDRPTERDFGLELDWEIRRLGATGNSFETIVASGPNGALPHHRPSDRVVAEGDLVVLDYGALVDGYCSDMTRTVVVGDPSPVQQRMLDVVTDAQAAGVAAVRSGAGCVEVDRVCRSIIEAAGWGDAFVHGTGHGVGLEIHEDPRLSLSADPAATLATGFVVTVEPGVYLPEHGGVRIEDTVVVLDDGCRPLTHATKDPSWPSRPTT
jgi:Xaa-Pro aminopeptidase